MRRIISLLLALAMLLSITTMSASGEGIIYPSDEAITADITIASEDTNIPDETTVSEETGIPEENTAPEEATVPEADIIQDETAPWLPVAAELGEPVLSEFIPEPYWSPSDYGMYGFEPGEGCFVARRTPNQIKAYVNAHPFNDSATVTYEQTPALYNNIIGRLSSKILNESLNTLNVVRYIAGLSEVTLDGEYCELAQAASFVNCVNDVMSHNPTKPSAVSEEVYQAGALGARRSNLGTRYFNPSSSIIHDNGYMADKGPGNIDCVGHRRWCLNPKMGKTGFGFVNNPAGSWVMHTAMYAFDSSNSSASEYNVAWPAQAMPVEYFGSDHPWSISTNRTVYDANVTLTRKSDGRVWTFNGTRADGFFNINNESYGQSGCIIFRPDNISSYRIGDVFSVKITGSGGLDISYNVEFFSLNAPYVCAHAQRERVPGVATTCVAEGKKAHEKCFVCGQLFDEYGPVIEQQLIIPKDLSAHEYSESLSYYFEHPHEEHQVCILCGAEKKTGNTTTLEGCSKCYPSITILYNANGGTEAPAPQTTQGGNLPILSEREPARQGYTFLGWATTAGASSAEYNPGDVIVSDKDITLYAVWKKNEGTANLPQIIIGNATAGPGDKVQIPIEIKNNPGIVTMSFGMRYANTVMRLTDSGATELIGEAIVNSDLTVMPYKYGWVGDFTNFTGDGIIAVPTFEIDLSAPRGIYDIIVEYSEENGDIFDGSGQPVKFEVVAGQITVTNAICGDVDGNGIVNMLDGIAIMKYFNKWDGFVTGEKYNFDPVVADVDGNCTVNMLDGIAVMKHFNKWSGYETLPIKK